MAGNLVHTMYSHVIERAVGGTKKSLKIKIKICGLGDTKEFWGERRNCLQRASVYCGGFLQFLWVQIQKFCRFRISLKKEREKFLNEMDVNMDVIACTCTDSLGVRTWLFDDPFHLRCQIINLSNRELLISFIIRKIVIEIQKARGDIQEHLGASKRLFLRNQCLSIVKWCNRNNRII